MKELRNHGDEVARILQAHLQDGVEPPAGLLRHFEDLMRMVSAHSTLSIETQTLSISLVGSFSQVTKGQFSCQNFVACNKRAIGL